ncbi:hypothetical protein JCM14469_12360 [Desulfatiferula olefinivorans]
MCLIGPFIQKTLRGLVTAAACLLLSSPAQAVQLGDPGVFSGLVEKLCPSLRPERFIAFTDYDTRHDETLRHAGLTYFNSHPDLVARIQKDLDSRQVNWHLETLSHRLAYAPESRADVADAFTLYCRQAVDELLRLTGHDNPISTISALTDPKPAVSDGRGIRVFIVHDLVREYTAQYLFSGGDDKQVMIDLSGRIPINEVGSYSSFLEYSGETNRWTFSRSPYSIWKSASSNPYTVLMTPLEETLHILLREHTEKAIIAALSRKNGPLGTDELKALMEPFMAVEEAVVGGLAYALIPQVITPRIPDLSPEWITADLTTKAGFHKYRYLGRGIELVAHLGLKESIALYARDPGAVRDLLISPSTL